MYEMTTLFDNTRIRADHNTFAVVVDIVNKGVTVQGDQVWIAPADGLEVKRGDQWLHVTSPHVGWMAYTHKGLAICTNLHEVGVEPPTDSDEVEVSVKTSFGNITTIKVKGTSIDKNNLVFILNDEPIFQ